MKPNIPTIPAIVVDAFTMSAEQKQNQRFRTASAISVTINILFLVGAANGMNEKPLALTEPDNIKPIQILPWVEPNTDPTTPKPAPKTPVKTQRVFVHKQAQRHTDPVKDNAVTNNTAEPDPIDDTNLVDPQVEPDQNDTPTPPDIAMVEPSDNNDASGATAADPSSAPSSADVAQNSGAAQTAASAAESGQRGGQIAAGVADTFFTEEPGEMVGRSTTGRNSDGATSLRVGDKTGAGAEQGVTGEARGTTGGIAIGTAIAVPQMADSTGPRANSSGAGKNILTQVNTATGSDDFVVSRGSGMEAGGNSGRTNTGSGVTGNASYSGQVAQTRGRTGSGTGFGDVRNLTGNGNGKTGPGIGNGGPKTSEGGVGTGLGGNGTSAFGIKGGAGNGANLGTGTGAAGGLGRTRVVIGSLAQTTTIVGNTIGTIENKNGPALQVGEVGLSNRVTGVSVPGGTLSPNIDITRDPANPGPGPDGNTPVKNAETRGDLAFTDAVIIARSKPVIAEDLKTEALQKVIVEFSIKPNGTSTFQIVRGSGNREVDAAVLTACNGYKWRAATRSGKPTESRQRIEFDPNI